MLFGFVKYIITKIYYKNLLQQTGKIYIKNNMKGDKMITDIDGNKYHTVKIGSQEWMRENLNVGRFRNGDPISEVKEYSEWQKCREKRKPAWCYYNNNPANGKIYGKLYNWYAVNDRRGLALEGWHIPSNKEWTKLRDYLGEEQAGGKLKSKLLWASPNTGATNKSGFSGLPGGNRSFTGMFFGFGGTGDWWSSSKSGNFEAWYRNLAYDHSRLGTGTEFNPKGYSIRCLRD